MKSEDDAPNRLLKAAEELFADCVHPDDISLRQIIAAADVGNASAIQYHFGDRDGLIRAIVAKHHPIVEARRHALLDLYEDQGREDLRMLASAEVQPFASKLEDPDGGRGYLRLIAAPLEMPHPMYSRVTVEDPTNSLYRWRALLKPLLSPEAIRLHRRFVAVQFTLAELARRVRDLPQRDNRLYVSHLTDLVTASLGAPISEETRRQIRVRQENTESRRSKKVSARKPTRQRVE